MEMENHTVEALLDIIKAHNLADVVDLAAWGHNDLFLTEKEAVTAEGDLNGAREAGVNVKSVEILDKQTMNDVSIFILFFPHIVPYLIVPEVWDAISRLPFSITQPLASKTCN
jgi:hypothetical protein